MLGYRFLTNPEANLDPQTSDWPVAATTGGLEDVKEEPWSVGSRVRLSPPVRCSLLLGASEQRVEHK